MYVSFNATKSTITETNEDLLCMELPYLFDRNDWSARIEQVKILDA